MGCTPSRAAALFVPLMRQPDCCRMASMCVRWIASNVTPPGSPPPAVAAQGARTFVELQCLAARVDQRALDDVLQLSHVARPVVPLKREHRGLRHVRDPAPELALAPMDKEPHQRRNVLRVVHEAAAGGLDRRSSGSTDPPGTGRPRRRLPGPGAWRQSRGYPRAWFERSRPARIHPPAARAAAWPESQAKIADLVQEDRAAIRQFETPQPSRDRARERSPFMPEQLALDERRRQRRAVDA